MVPSMCLAQGYHEAQHVARELADQPPIERLPAEVALLISYPDAWTTEIEPHHADFDYWQMARTIYRDFWLRGINVDIIARGQDLRQYRHVIPVAPQLIDEDEAEQWRVFVRDGGKLTLTIRSSIKDQDNVWTDQPLPASLTDLVGGQVVQWYALPPGVTAHYEHESLGPIAVPIWIEDLRPDDPRTTLQYTARSVPGLAQVVSTSSQIHGSRGGSAQYVGVYPPDPRSGLFSGTALSTTGNIASPFNGTIERVRLKAGQLVLNHAPVEQSSNAVEDILPPLGSGVSQQHESG
jgi:beta-galactosidase